MANQKDVVYFFGIAFFTLSIAAVFNTVYMGNPAGILWLCYIGIFLISLGMIFRNPLFIVSQLNILSIPLVIWTIDFLYVALTGGEFLGITNYFFEGGFHLVSKIISLQHLFTIPASFFVLYKLKVRSTEKIKNAWKISLAQLFGIFFLTILLTNRESNINCVYEACMKFSLLGTSIPYPLIWFGSVTILVFATNFVIMRIFGRGN